MCNKKLKKDAEELLSNELLELKGGKEGVSSLDSGCFFGCESGCESGCKQSCKEGNSSGLSTPT